MGVLKIAQPIIIIAILELPLTTLFYTFQSVKLTESFKKYIYLGTGHNMLVFTRLYEALKDAYS
jgi:hypothetical protein